MQENNLENLQIVCVFRCKSFIRRSYIIEVPLTFWQKIFKFPHDLYIPRRKCTKVTNRFFASVRIVIIVIVVVPGQ